MPVTVEAIYENGALKLSQPLPLREHQRVQVTVHIGPTLAERTAGMMGWTGSSEAADDFAMSPELDDPIPTGTGGHLGRHLDAGSRQGRPQVDHS